MKLLPPQHGVALPFRHPQQRGRALEVGDQLVVPIHAPVEVAQHDERHALLAPLRDPALQRGHLPAQRVAGAAAAGQPPLMAAGFQMNAEQPEPRARKVERDVDAAAEREARLGLHVERDHVRVLVCVDPSPHRETDPLDHVVVREIERVAVGREHLGSRLRPVHLLQGHDVGIQRARVISQQRPIPALLGDHVGRQRRVALRPQREPLQVPGRDLQLAAARPARSRRPPAARTPGESQQGGLRGRSRILGAARFPVQRDARRRPAGRTRPRHRAADRGSDRGRCREAPR